MVSYNEFILLKNHLKTQQSIQLKVRGHSMLPFIKNQDILKVNYINNLELLKRFDIIVFFQDGHYICHYFWRFNKYFNTLEKKFITRPLNPLRNVDKPSTTSNILGKVENFKIPIWFKVKIILISLVLSNRDGYA